MRPAPRDPYLTSQGFGALTTGDGSLHLCACLARSATS